MTDERTNWTRALEDRAVGLLVSDLIEIGCKLGMPLAERVYLSLRDEPRDAQGNKIDWVQIRCWIENIH